MNSTIRTGYLSLAVFLAASGSSWAQQPEAAPAAEAAPPEVTTTAIEPVAAEAAAVEQAPAAAEAAEAEPAAPAEQAAPTTMTAQEIMRHHPSEWAALLDRRKTELRRMRQQAYPTWQGPWGSPHSSWFDSRAQGMEDQIQQRMDRLQRRIDAERGFYMSPWDRASSDWYDYQRNLSRLQSLQTQEYFESMIQRGMRSYPRYPTMRGPWGW